MGGLHRVPLWLLLCSLGPFLRLLRPLRNSPGAPGRGAAARLGLIYPSIEEAAVLQDAGTTDDDAQVQWDRSEAV